MGKASRKKNRALQSTDEFVPVPSQTVDDAEMLRRAENGCCLRCGRQMHRRALWCSRCVARVRSVYAHRGMSAHL